MTEYKYQKACDRWAEHIIQFIDGCPQKFILLDSKYDEGWMHIGDVKHFIIPDNMVTLKEEDVMLELL